jgi:hypothetical protein
LFSKLEKKNLHKYNLIYENFKKQFFKLQTNVQFDFKKLLCIICNSTKNLELYYVQNFVEIRAQIFKLKFKYKNFKFLEHNNKNIIKLIHYVKKYKQIVFCYKCHIKINNKTLKKNYLEKFIRLL